MDPRVATTLKIAFFTIVVLFLGSFIMKHVNRSKKTAKLAAEMRTLVSDTSFYKSPTVETAHAALFKGIALMADAKKIGLEPNAYFDEVFKREKKDKVGLDDEFEEYPAREKLARDTYQRAYQMAEHFGMLDSPEKIEELREGKMPEGVSPKPVIANVIDPALSPGMEKIVPNLDLRAAGQKAGPPTDMEVAAARNLSSDLYAARVIESDADNRISKHYDKRKKGETEVKPAPAPEPKPEVKPEVKPEPKPAESEP